MRAWLSIVLMAVFLMAAPGGMAATAMPGVTVTWRLAKPTRQLDFAQGSNDVRTRNWTVLTPGVSLTDQSLLSDKPFTSVQVRIAPDAAERDRVYPGLYKLGQGYVLYSPYLQTSTPSRLLVDGAPFAGKDYAFAGKTPASSAGSAAASIIVDPATPDWLKQIVLTQIPAALDYYRQALNEAAPSKITVLVGPGPGPTPLKADVQGRTISIRFSGDGWATRNDAYAIGLASLVMHETFHLWTDAARHDTAASDSAPWLHEGEAEYAAIRASVRTGIRTQDQGYAEILKDLTGCRATLGAKSLSQAAVTGGSGVYACGVTLQWLADVAGPPANGDFFGIWRRVYAKAAVGSHTYDVPDFVTAAGANPALDLVLNGTGEDRWDRLESLLAGRGVKLTEAPIDSDYQWTLLRSLERQACGDGQMGFFSGSGFLQLDGAPTCSDLQGLKVSTVDGHNLLTDAAASYDAAAMDCRSSGAVRLGTPDGKTVSVQCKAPLPEPGKSYKVVQAPPLGAL